MSERRSWENPDELAEDKPELSESEQLWTRRNALALTAGFFAVSAPGAAPAFVQRPQELANHIVISKKKRVMALMRGNETIKRYRVKLGFSPSGHKQRSGDGRTPEGRYYIDRRNPRSDFHLSLGINYPNAQDIMRARSKGMDPGGDIFIHGGPNRQSRKKRGDWTAGCVAVSDREIEEIWAMTPTGIPVTILA